VYLALPTSDRDSLTFLDLPPEDPDGPFAGAPADLETRILSLAAIRL